MPDELRASSVRIAVGRDKELVGLAGTRHDAEPSIAQLIGELFRQEKLFVGHATGTDDGDLRSGKMLQARGDRLICLRPGNRLKLTSCIALQWLGEARLVIDVVKIEAMGIRHPAGIDGIVLARGDAMNLIATGPDCDVRARAAIDVDALGFLQEPDAHLETEVVRG